MKKVLCIFLLVLLTLSFTACPRRDADPVIRLFFWDANQVPGIQRVLDEFTAETGIRTRLDQAPWGDYWTVLEASATAGTLPDIFVMNTLEIQRYMAAGLIMDLTDRINRSNLVDKGRFPQDVVNIYSFEGRNYGIIKDIDTIALWFNKRHFEEAGIPFPTDNWNWNDLRNAAQRLTNPAIGRFGYVHNAGESQTGYWNFIYQNDGYVIDTTTRRRSGFDNPRTIEAMEFVVGMIRDGLSPSVEVTEQTGKMDLFLGGMVSMATFGSWMLGTFNTSPWFQQNAGVVMLPMGPRGTRATIYNGLAWSGSANTAHPEEVWRILEFLGSERGQRRLSEEGVAISGMLGTADAFFSQFTHWDAAAYMRMMDYAVMRPYSLNTGGWEFGLMVPAMQEAFGLRRPVAVIMRELAERMNAHLAAERL